MWQESKKPKAAPVPVAPMPTTDDFLQKHIVPIAAKIMDNCLDYMFIGKIKSCATYMDIEEAFDECRSDLWEGTDVMMNGLTETEQDRIYDCINVGLDRVSQYLVAAEAYFDGDPEIDHTMYGWTGKRLDTAKTAKDVSGALSDVVFDAIFEELF